MAKPKVNFSRRDLLLTILCTLFALANLAAVGRTGRRRAKEAVCLSNLRQWGAMFQKYTEEHHGCFMQGVNGVAGTLPDGSNDNRWVKALGPYYKWESKITCCPEATRSWYSETGQDMHLTGTDLGSTTAWGYYQNAGWVKPVKGSYGINGWANNPDPGAPGQGGKPLAWHWRTPYVKGARYVPLLVGCQRYNSWPESNDSPPPYDGELWGDVHMRRVCINRHDGSVNCVFMDWSARKVGLKELWTLKWHRTYNTASFWTKAGGVRPSDWPPWMRGFKDY